MIFDLKQIEYIILNLNISEKLKNKLTEHKELTKEDYDEIYEISSERLQTHGFNFDKTYNINEEGKMLEEIIDKLT